MGRPKSGLNASRLVVDPESNVFHHRDRGFLPGEMAMLLAACLLLASFPLVQLPVAVVAAFVVAAMIARRWLVLGRRDAAAPAFAA